MVTVGGEVGCLTLVVVLAAVFGGIWLDRLFDTKPVIMIILVLAAAPLSLVLTFWVAMRAVKDINNQPSTGVSQSKGAVKPLQDSSEEGGEDR
jgi:F0F1-type ATP synthase assembly protein I